MGYTQEEKIKFSEEFKVRTKNFCINNFTNIPSKA